MEEYWEIIESPQGKTYEQLIKVLCDYSDYFYFITRKELTYDVDVLRNFEPYILEKYKTKQWANTRTKGPAATVYVIEVNDNTCKLLQTSANSLYDWVASQLPEDLTFLKNDFAWFTSTTHEEFAGFSIRTPYYKKIIEKIEGLKIEFVP